MEDCEEEDKSLKDVESLARIHQIPDNPNFCLIIDKKWIKFIDPSQMKLMEKGEGGFPCGKSTASEYRACDLAKAVAEWKEVKEKVGFPRPLFDPKHSTKIENLLLEIEKAIPEENLQKEPYTMPAHEETRALNKILQRLKFIRSKYYRQGYLP